MKSFFLNVAAGLCDLLNMLLGFGAIALILVAVCSEVYALYAVAFGAAGLRDFLELNGLIFGMAVVALVASGLASLCNNLEIALTDKFYRS